MHRRYGVLTVGCLIASIIGFIIGFWFLFAGIHAGPYTNGLDFFIGIPLLLVSVGGVFYFTPGRSEEKIVKHATTRQQDRFYPVDNRGVKHYLSYDFSTHQGHQTTIEDNKQWAIIEDTYDTIGGRPKWEVWVRGKLKHTVFSKREAEESMRKYQSGEYT